MKNHLIFGLIGVLLIGGTVLPAMSQTQSAESISEIILSLDKPSYDLNEPISISGQVTNFVPNTRDPTLNYVEIIFIDSSGDAISTSGFDDSGKQVYFPVKLKAYPDQLGNFRISTNLSSVLFSYDTYAIQASTYQDGKIATTYDLVITSPVEEELVVEGDPLTFETCSVVLGSISDELKSTECTSENDFVTGDLLVVKGNVILSDPTSDSKYSIEQQKLQPNQITPQFVKITIPYAKTMTLVVNNNNFVTTTGDAVFAEQTKRLKDVSASILPDEEGNFATYFDLPTTVFESGIYSVKATYMGYDAENTVRIIDGASLIDTDPEIIVTTDKTEFYPGETVQISGQIQNSLYSDVIDVFITTPDVSGYNCTVIDCTVGENELKIVPELGLTEHPFSFEYELSSHEASLGKYTVIAGSSIGVSAETTFFVTEESVIVETEPVELEEPIAPKKIIKKFNSISDSEILITLNDMDSDSELLPRVMQGSLFTTARGQEADINIQVSTSSGQCIIGQESSCLVTESTRKPGAIYETVSIDENNYKIRYSGTDVRLEKFSILPESTGTELDIKDWNIEIIKDDQPTRFYYKVSYVNLE